MKRSAPLPTCFKGIKVVQQQEADTSRSFTSADSGPDGSESEYEPYVRTSLSPVTGPKVSPKYEEYDESYGDDVLDLRTSPDYDKSRLPDDSMSGNPRDSLSSYAYVPRPGHRRRRLVDSEGPLPPEESNPLPTYQARERMKRPRKRLREARTFADPKEEDSQLTTLNGKLVRGVPTNLSDEQKAVVEAVLSGQSIFFTGCAGTGKSFTLKALTAAMRACTGSSHGIFFTAMTGVAASLIPNASTLHSFAGIGRGDGADDTIIRRVKGNKKASDNWKNCRILVIDEVSMLSRKLFEVLDVVARAMKGRRDLPFGGIQLVCCGDFFQLPPVSKENETSTTKPMNASYGTVYVSGGQNSITDDSNAEKEFCFESGLWNQIIKSHIVLKKVFRQQDMELVNLLSEVRYNRISDESLKLLQSLNRPLKCPDDIDPTFLTPFNAHADSINNNRLNRLPKDREWIAFFVQKHLKDFKPTKSRPLPADDQYDQSMGEKIKIPCDLSFSDIPSIRQPHPAIDSFNPNPEKFPCFLFEGNFDYNARDSGTDLILVDGFDRNTCFPRNLSLRIGAQVMLLKNYNQMQLVNGSTGVVVGFRSSNSIDRTLEDVLESVACPDEMILPLVQFTSGRLVTVGIESYEVEHPTGSGPPRARREQVPLRLAWAITIHKAQGMTLDYLQVDCARVFESGQAYVALSRARSIEGLQILSFDPSKCWCNQKVVEFYKTFCPVPEGPARTASLAPLPTVVQKNQPYHSTIQTAEPVVIRSLGRPPQQEMTMASVFTRMGCVPPTSQPLNHPLLHPSLQKPIPSAFQQPQVRAAPVNMTNTEADRHRQASLKLLNMFKKN